jgi:hypothetical protein
MYTTQFQAGLGMIHETMDLLRLWEPGMGARDLSRKAVAEGTFARTTARRTENIVTEMFAPRYLVQDGRPAAWLKKLVERGATHEDLKQLFYLYTARAQRILYDFVAEAYWPRYATGGSHLGKNESVRFIEKALVDGRMQKRWTDSTIKRVSGYLLGVCADMGLLEEGARSDRAIRHFAIRPKVALYLAHELHFSGLGDRSVTSHPDWALFGLEPNESLNEVKKLAHDGHLIIQAAADLVQIAWKYKTMEDCIDAIA